MKTNVLLAFILAGAATFTSCTKKVDEKTMADINQFGTDWSAVGEKANNWSKQLMNSDQQAKEFAAKQTAVMNTNESSWDAVTKTKMQDVVKAANENAAGFDAMVTDWNTFKTSWDENTKAFTEWQGKVTKGEVTPDDAVKGLADWKNKMNEAQQKMDNWNTAYNTMKETCDKNMAMSDEMAKSTTTPATPAKGKTKK